MKAVDTNVLIYALDTADLVKHQQAVSLLHQLPHEEDLPPLLWQVACEYLAYLHRQQHFGRFSEERVAEEFQRVADNFPLILPNPDILSHARELFTRYSLSHWDSLLLAACISAGVDTLYSEDMSPGMTYDSVTVINPFQTT